MVLTSACLSIGWNTSAEHVSFRLFQTMENNLRGMGMDWKQVGWYRSHLYTAQNCTSITVLHMYMVMAFSCIAHRVIQHCLVQISLKNKRKKHKYNLIKFEETYFENKNYTKNGVTLLVTDPPCAKSTHSPIPQLKTAIT